MRYVAGLIVTLIIGIILGGNAGNEPTTIIERIEVPVETIVEVERPVLSGQCASAVDLARLSAAETRTIGTTEGEFKSLVSRAQQAIANKDTVQLGLVEALQKELARTTYPRYSELVTLHSELDAALAACEAQQQGD